jgi:hypothetical protein
MFLSTARRCAQRGLRLRNIGALSTIAVQTTKQQQQTNHEFGVKEAFLAAFLGLCSGTTLTLMEEKKAYGNYVDPKKPGFNVPPPREDLPIYSLEQVAEHNDEDSLWYTFRGGVYDLTSFINGHPGGTPVGDVLNRCKKFDIHSQPTHFFYPHTFTLN